MPTFEINYREPDGSLIEKIEANCSTDKDAKILAHALKPQGAHEMDVWCAHRLVYARPHSRAERFLAMAVGAAL